jgi:hypothetical protein
MRTDHTPASRAAVAVAVGLALVQLAWVTDASPVVDTAAWSLGALTVLAAAKMARDNCFESRLVAVIVASIQLATAALAATVGAPGSTGHGLTAHLTLAAAFAGSVLVLIALDHRTRARAAGDRPLPPYAS